MEKSPSKTRDVLYVSFIIVCCISALTSASASKKAKKLKCWSNMKTRPDDRTTKSFHPMDLLNHEEQVSCMNGDICGEVEIYLKVRMYRRCCLYVCVCVCVCV